MNSSCQSLFSNHIRVLLKVLFQKTKAKAKTMPRNTHTHTVVVFKDETET